MFLSLEIRLAHFYPIFLDSFSVKRMTKKTFCPIGAAAAAAADKIFPFLLQRLSIPFCSDPSLGL